MNNKNNHQPALPTFPVQDQFNNVIISYGVTKLEYIAAQIAAGMATLSTSLEPETIAQVAVEIAECVLTECEIKLKDVANENKLKL
jgi:hypothetical protein